MKISKRTRDAAIHCLEQCASDRIGKAHGMNRETCTFDVEECAAEQLACDAWEAADRIRGMTCTDVYLEAAALLRDGWCPGEPVVILATGKLA